MSGTAIGSEMDMLIEMREGDVPGVRIFNPKGRLTEWAAAEGIDPPSKDMGDWLHENGCRQKRKRYTDDSGKRRQRRFWLGVGIEDGNHVQEQTDAL